MKNGTITQTTSYQKNSEREMLLGKYVRHMLILKQLGHFFWHFIVFSNNVHYEYDMNTIMHYADIDPISLAIPTCVLLLLWSIPF